MDNRRRALYELNNNLAAAGNLRDTATFFAPLTTSIAMSKGTGSPTFTRATIGSVTDQDGVPRVTLSGEARFQGARRVRNLLSFSQDFADATWLKISGGVAVPVVTADQIAAPDGTMTADRIVYPAVAVGQHSLVVQTPVLPNSGTACYSVWARSASGTGVVYLNWEGQVAATCNLTTSWQRFALQVTLTAAAKDLYFGFFATAFPGQLTDGITIYAWGAQVELTAAQADVNPGAYVSTNVLSSPYHGANVDGVKYFDTVNGNSITSNVVSEGSGGSIPGTTLLGFLSETARTNICLQSEVLSNAAWVAVTCTVGNNETASPDGTTTAESLTASAGNGTLIQAIVSAANTYTFSVWLKRKTGTGNIQLTLDAGVAWTTVAVTSSWARYTLTQAALTNPNPGIRIVTNADAVYAWGAQVEIGAFVSSYIPTVGSGVTRNLDLLTYVQAGNLSNTNGTIIGEATLPVISTSLGTNTPVLATSGAAAGPSYVHAIGHFTCYDGTNNADTNGSLAAGTTYHLASAWALAGNKVAFRDGANSAGEVAFDGDMGVGANFQVGSFMRVRNVRVFGRKLTDAEIASL